MNDTLKKVINLNFWFIYLFISFLFCLCYLSLQHYIFTKEIYLYNFSDQLSISQVENLIDVQNKYEFLSYVLLLLISLFKYTIISLILLTAFTIADIKVNYHSLIKIVVLCELIFIIPFIIKLIWFSSANSNYTIEDVQFFMPLSLLNIFDYTTLNKILIYPFQLLNIFEIIYWVLLGYGISKLINNNFDKAFKIVLIVNSLSTDLENVTKPYVFKLLKNGSTMDYTFPNYQFIELFDEYLKITK
jgi:hypothetical protein